MRHRYRHGNVAPCTGCARFGSFSSLLRQGALYNPAGPTPGRLQEINDLLHVDLTATHAALARAKTLNIPDPDNLIIRPISKVGFLFMLMDGLDHEPVWDAFFEHVGEDLFSIYTHQATPKGSQPLEKWGAIRVPQTQTGWCALSGVEVAVFVEALADPANVQFVLVSQNTVPLKPFPYVYSQLVEKSPTTSKICYASKPRKKNLLDEFIHRSCTFGDWYRSKSPRVWKHHQWVVLSRQHAFTFVRNAVNALYRHFQTALLLGGRNDGCSDEAVVSAALLLAEEQEKHNTTHESQEAVKEDHAFYEESVGDEELNASEVAEGEEEQHNQNQTMVKERHLTRDASSSSSKEGHAGDDDLEGVEEMVASDDLARVGVQQACLTWVRWRNCFAGTPLSLEDSYTKFAKKSVEAGRKTLEDFLATRRPSYKKLAKQVQSSLNGFPHFFGPPAEDPTVKISYLRYLVVETGFMFGRKFNEGCLVSVSSNQSAQTPSIETPLQDVLPSLWEEVITDIASSRVWSRLDARGMP